MNTILRRVRPSAFALSGFLLVAAAAVAAPEDKPKPVNPFQVAPPPFLNPANPDEPVAHCGTGIWKRNVHIHRPVAQNRLINVTDTEPNNSTATAQSIALGFDIGEDTAVDIAGSIGASAGTVAFSQSEPNEDINTASASGFVAGTSEVRTTTGSIANTPATGEFDFIRFDLNAGQSIRIETSNTPSLDPIVRLYSSTGTVLGTDDDSGAGNDSLLSVTVPSTGAYFLCVAGFRTGGGAASFPTDPFNGASGQGVGSTGTYSLSVGIDSTDVDFYSFDANAGDIVGAGVQMTGSTVSLFASDGTTLLIGSEDNAAGIYPITTQLPVSGDALMSYVLPSAGTYYIRIEDDGVGSNYSSNVRLFRNIYEATPELTHQYLFLDFNGGTVDTSIFGDTGVATLSPLTNFLAGWGLTAGDEAVVIDKITQRVQAIFDDVATNGNNGDLDATGTPGQFKITVLNSKDHPDMWGQPNVSRIIIGGTIAELGISTIGIAESIDVGNFETEETAVVLLDLLSGTGSNSLNQYSFTGGLTKADVIGIGVGNITAHEAAHFYGCWHTDQFNALANIIDQGGNLDNTVGVGIDNIFGTADDVNVVHGNDTYNPNEGFLGTEDCKNAHAFGLSTGMQTGIFDDILTNDVTYTGSRSGTGDVVDIDYTGNADEVLLTVNASPQTIVGVNIFTVLLHTGDDVVTAVASPTVPILVDGGGQTASDLLTFDDEGLVFTPAVAPVGSGTMTAAGKEPFSYSGFEAVNTIPVELSAFTLE